MAPVARELAAKFVDKPTTETVVVGSVGDAREATERGWRRLIHVAHGLGQRYGKRQGMRSRARMETTSLLCLPNAYVAESLNFTASAVEITGDPMMDELVGLRRPRGRTVAISFRWRAHYSPEASSAFDHYRDSLADIVRELDGIEVLGHGHPRLWSEIEPFWRSIGVEPVADFREVCERASVYVCDNSSTLFEFAALDRPVVAMNAPWYRRDVEHGLRFWAHADVGEQVDGPDELAAAIRRALDDDPHAERRREVVAEVFPFLGWSARRTAEVIREHLSNPEVDVSETMKIKLLRSRAGAEVTYKAGEIAEFPAGEALRLIKAGKAEPVGETPAQRAVKRAAETEKKARPEKTAARRKSTRKASK